MFNNYVSQINAVEVLKHKYSVQTELYLESHPWKWNTYNNVR